MSKFLKDAKQRQMRVEDMGGLTDHYKSSVNIRRLQSTWAQYQARRNSQGWDMVKCILKTFKRELTISGIINFIGSLLNMANPLLIKYFLEFLQNPDDYELSTGIILATCMVLSRFGLKILEQQLSLFMETLGHKANSVQGMVYKKVLRLAPSSTKSYSHGEIINLLSVDARKINELTYQVQQLVGLPLQFVYSFILLFIFFGWALFFALGFMMAISLIVLVLGKFLAKVQKRKMKLSDERMKIMTEVLNSIKVIKFNNWIEQFTDRVIDARKREARYVKFKFIINIFIIFLTISSTPMLTLVLFSAALWLGQTFTVAIAFSALSTIGMLRSSINWFPNFYNFMVEFLVSMKRIEDFLREKELDPGMVEKQVGQASFQNLNAIEMRPTTFVWDDMQNPYIKQAKDDKNKGKKGKQSKPEEEKLVVSINDDIESTVDDERVTQEFKLEELAVTVKKGELVCVIGKVGCGKTSLLHTILGNLYKENNHGHVPVTISGSVALAEQVPWIQNKTIKENIIFGKELDEDLYDETIEICQMDADLEILPAGDQTEIGEKGVNLSGGQKARVGLARAVYSQNDIVLMDDPLSALDANVKKKIFHDVILTKMQGKTRILVTHALDFLHLVDRVILMKDGKVQCDGPLDQVRDHPLLNELLSHFNEINEEIEKEQDQSSNRDSTALHQKTKDPKKVAKPQSKMMVNENDENIVVDKSQFIRLFSQNNGWIMLLIGWTFSALYKAAQIGASYYPGQWINNINHPEERTKFVWLIIACTIGSGISQVITRAAMTYFAISVTTNIHGKMVKSIMHAPVNTYFDVTPMGSILNRFSKDLNMMDNFLPLPFIMTMNLVVTVIFTLLLAGSTSYFVYLCIPFIFMLCIWLSRKFLRPFKECVRIESVVSSDVLKVLGETISGTSTIRAYEKVREYERLNEDTLDRWMRTNYFLTGAHLWFSLRISTLSFLFFGICLGFCIANRKDVDPVLLGTTLIFMVDLQINLVWMFRMYAQVEKRMVAFIRTSNLLDIPQEKFDSKHDDSDWRNDGSIHFDNLEVKYRPDTELVLKGLDLKVKPGEKVGVVGRTGAGKSTLCLALCRILEPESGAIRIGGKDTQALSLTTLRENITIIPQDPIIFKGTLKFNLDPTQKHPDHTLTSLAMEAHLESLLQREGGLETEIAENGSNLSSGQKQLICIIRAILRKNKIILLDEATANIDIQTEKTIQELIQNEFSESTMVVVAHRLNTIMKSDRVLVMSEGKAAEFDTPKALLDDPTSRFYQLVNSHSPDSDII